MNKKIIEVAEEVLTETVEVGTRKEAFPEVVISNSKKDKKDEVVVDKKWVEVNEVTGAVTEVVTLETREAPYSILSTDSKVASVDMIGMEVDVEDEATEVTHRPDGTLIEADAEEDNDLFHCVMDVDGDGTNDKVTNHKSEATCVAAGGNWMK